MGDILLTWVFVLSSIAALCLIPLSIKRWPRGERSRCPGPRRGWRFLLGYRWLVLRGGCWYNLKLLQEDSDGKVCCPECGTDRNVSKLLKEGREFGVGTILSTQELTHFKTSNNDYSGYILSWIIHRVPSIKSQDIKSLFNTAGKDEIDTLMNGIRELEKHQSIYIDGEKHIAKIRDLAFWELLSK